MVGASQKMQEVFALVQQVAPSRAAVLITGESGTGKELAARAIHALSPRRAGPFVAINCAAMPDTLMESELFGHEKGAFTGAVERRAGCFELAQNGTVLLDEIGDMPVATQAKLLRVLEDGRVRRLGGEEPKFNWTCGSSRPPIRRSITPSAKADSARICSIASTFFRFRCRRCGIARRICRCWPRRCSRI